MNHEGLTQFIEDKLGKAKRSRPGGFNAQRWRLKVAADQRETLAALLCAMYWRGCRHPLALGTAQLHRLYAFPCGT